MKRLRSYLGAFLLMVSAFCFSACETDTHYDALTAVLKVSIPETPYTDNKAVIYQRITFDRDIVLLSSIDLGNAYLSAISDFDEDLMAIVQNATVAIVDPVDNETIRDYWLITMDSMRHKNEAKLVEFVIDDLATYFGEYNDLKIMVELELDPYQAMKYRLEHCGGETACSFELMLSMTFDMKD